MGLQASPSFQVLPHCVAGATMLIESDVDAGCTLAAVLAAAGEGGGPDMTGLIELLGEHGVVELI